MQHRISCPEKNILFGKGVMEIHRLEQGKSGQSLIERKVGTRLQDTGVHKNANPVRPKMLKPPTLGGKSTFLPCEAKHSPIGSKPI